jgi:cobalt/nickel transport system permease protein
MVGPVGVLLGPAAGFQVVFVASAMLAFVGHGGFTVIGLNALILGSGAAIAHRVYAMVARRMSAAAALALATALGQAVAGLLWLGVVGFGLRSDPRALPHWPALDARRGAFLAVALPLWALGIAVESAIAFGLGRFLARVQPDLLPFARTEAARETL